MFTNFTNPFAAVSKKDNSWSLCGHHITHPEGTDLPCLFHGTAQNSR